ncbi:MAG TPA: hypothetical protein VK853_06955 [Ilumatobacteraceae bacterium]|nr:hypothetical protein [Ilumatobacteraceae bacterium]
MSEVPPPDDRRSRLLGVKLRALVGEHLGREPVDPADVGTFPSGAALVVDGAGWVLVEGNASRSLGGALAWALRQGATALNVVAESDTGLLARRAAHLTFPVSIWFAQDRTLLAAVPEPLADSSPPSDDHLALVEVIAAAGATPNIEHGVVFGEVYGLEVCRVVDEPTVGHIAELGELDVAAIAAAQGREHDGVLLEVGVGATDREAFRLLHGEIPTVEALASVVVAVATYRSPDAPQHPLNRLGQERYLRWRLEQDPGLIDMRHVAPAAPPVPRPNLKDPIPCLATATDHDGREHTIVCSVGVDLDLVGFVADVHELDERPVTVVLRERDRIPITEELLGLLARPVTVRTI